MNRAERCEHDLSEKDYAVGDPCPLCAQAELRRMRSVFRAAMAWYVKYAKPRAEHGNYMLAAEHRLCQSCARAEAKRRGEKQSPTCK